MNSGTKKYWICSFDSAIIYLYGVSRLSAAAGEWFRGELPQYRNKEADFMAEHPIQDLMNVTMDKVRQMVDSNTIIGKPITTEDGITILPVSKVSFGFASGGTDFDGKNAANKDLFGGGSGAGVNIQPVAFLVVKDGCVRTIQLSDSSNTVDRALTMIPELVEKVSALLNKKEAPAAPEEEKPQP